MPQAKFSDHFSGHAVDYAKFRPRYPKELFRWLASVAPSTELAWDCATGNGQAAVELAEVFERVIATDASEKQIVNAEKHPRVEYRVAPAEESGLESNNVDLWMRSMCRSLDEIYVNLTLDERERSWPCSRR